MSTLVTGIVDQGEYKDIILKIDVIFSFLIRAAVVFGILVHYCECIAFDRAVNPDHNRSIAVCYKTGIGLNMKRDGVVNGSIQESFPIPVIDWLCMKMRQD